MKKQIFYFADKEDLNLLSKKIDNANRFLFTQTGLFDSEDELVNYDSLSEIGSLGYLSSGDMNHNKSFLVTEKGNQPQIRKVWQRRGGVKYAIDQKENLESSVLLLSGEFKKCIIMGKVASIHSNDKAQEITNFLHNTIKVLAHKFKGVLLMGGSIEKMKQGWILTDYLGSNNNWAEANLDKYLSND